MDVLSQMLRLSLTHNQMMFKVLFWVFEKASKRGGALSRLRQRLERIFLPHGSRPSRSASRGAGGNKSKEKTIKPLKKTLLYHQKHNDKT